MVKYYFDFLINFSYGVVGISNVLEKFDETKMRWICLYQEGKERHVTTKNSHWGFFLSFSH